MYRLAAAASAMSSTRADSAWVNSSIGDGVDEPVLEDVGRVDPAADPAVEPGLDHAAEAGPVAGEGLAGGGRVAGPGPVDEPGVVVEGAHEGGLGGLTV
jgi:hypothetical protein